MAAAAGGGAVTLHLLASLTSLATCLVVLARLGMPYLDSLPVLGGSRAVGAIQLRNTDRSSWDIGGSSMLPTSLSAEERCLAAASDGAWRRVSSLTRTSPLPPDVAAWHAEDAFTFANEVFTSHWRSFSYEWAWSASAVAECGMRRRTPAKMSAAFSKRRLVFLGDSHVLYMHNWLATALGGNELAKGVPRVELWQTINGSSIRLDMYHQRWLDAINAQLRSWTVEDWPDVLVLDSAEWPLFVDKNMMQHVLQMRELLTTLQQQAPPFTFIVWLSPPARDEKKWDKVALPAEWIHMYDRVAQDLGFYWSEGPAFHLDLFQLALDCLAWCTIEDGIHVVPTVNEVLALLLTNAYLAWRAGGAIPEVHQPSHTR